MLHKESLKLLIPVELGATHAADLDLEGEQLDSVAVSACDLLLEIFPDTATRTLVAWENLFGLAVTEGSTLQQRRSNVLVKLRAVGGLSRAYFIELAAYMGYTIVIDEPFATEGPHAWRITFTSVPVYEFYADESCAEELLLDWPSQTAAEGLFQDLKPAHSRLIIAYA